MKYAFVLENEVGFQKKIVAALKEIDSQMLVTLFENKDQLMSWIKNLMEKGRQGVDEGGDGSEVSLVVCKPEFFGKDPLPIIQNFRNLLLSKEFCKKEEPTPVVLTAFDGPEFKIKTYEVPEIRNVIYKPFDDLILRQHLADALAGHKASSFQVFASQSVNSKIEMLREVPLDSLSETGFTATSDQKLQVGSLAKYYSSNLFLSGKIKSVLARIIACEPHPTKKGKYLTRFQYVGIDPDQLGVIRKKLMAIKSKDSTDFMFKTIEDPAHVGRIVVLDEDAGLREGLQQSVTRNFSNILAHPYADYRQFLLHLDAQSYWGVGKEFYGTPAPAVSEFKMVFSADGTKILGLEGTFPENCILFGKPLAYFDGLLQRVKDLFVEKSKKKFEALVARKFQPSLTEDSFYEFTDGKKMIPVKIDGLEPMTFKGVQGLAVKVKVPDDSELVKWIQANSPLQGAVAQMYISEKEVRRLGSDEWDKIVDIIRKKHPKATLTVISYTDKDEAQKLELLKKFDDIIFKNTDKGFIVKILKMCHPELSHTQKELTILAKYIEDSLKVATKVDVSGISESGLKLAYHREIPVDEFREFMFWQTDEINAPQIKGYCNYNLESQNKEAGGFECNFVFFGMSDFYLKRVRLWIRDQYITAKEKST